MNFFERKRVSEIKSRHKSLSLKNYKAIGNLQAVHLSYRN
jgi:hypothetical protein